MWQWLLFIVTVITLVFGCLNNRQRPFSDSNLSADIDHKSYTIKSWYLGGSDPDLYECGISDLPYHEKRSVFLRPKAAETPDTVGACIMQMFKADRYRGSRMHFSAAVKTDRVYKSGLWMTVNGPNGLIKSDFMHNNRPIKGSTDWNIYSIVLQVPEESVNIAIAMFMRGNGRVWFADVHFEETDEETTPVLPDEPGNLDFSED